MTKDTLIGIQINCVSVYSVPDGRLLLQVLNWKYFQASEVLNFRLERTRTQEDSHPSELTSWLYLARKQAQFMFTMYCH